LLILFFRLFFFGGDGIVKEDADGRSVVIVILSFPDRPDEGAQEASGNDYTDYDKYNKYAHTRVLRVKSIFMFMRDK